MRPGGDQGVLAICAAGQQGTRKATTAAVRPTGSRTALADEPGRKNVTFHAGRRPGPSGAAPGGGTAHRGQPPHGSTRGVGDHGYLGRRCGEKEAAGAASADQPRLVA